MGCDAIAAALDGADKSEPDDLKLARVERSDRGNAKRLRLRFGDDLFYVDESGWYGWTGKTWCRADGTALATIAAQNTAQAIRKEAAAALAHGPLKSDDGLIHEKLEDFEDRINALRTWAVLSGNVARAGYAGGGATAYARGV